MESSIAANGSYLAFLIVLVGSIVQGSVGIGLGFVADYPADLLSHMMPQIPSQDQRPGREATAGPARMQ